MVPDRLFTIGHSTRSFEELVDLLRREGVRHLIDVRAFPASRRYPHFSRPSLESSLRCHRNLVSDAAEARGFQVFHILDAATSRHTLTSFATVRDSRVRYDEAGQSELFQP